MLSQLMTSLPLEHINVILAHEDGGNIIQCPHCKQYIQKNVMIPEHLQKLHFLCVHLEADAKFKN